MTENESMIITKYDLLYEQRMTRVECAIENIAKSMNNMDSNMREGLNKLDNRLWALILLIPGAIITTGLAAIIAKICHWI